MKIFSVNIEKIRDLKLKRNEIPPLTILHKEGIYFRKLGWSDDQKEEILLASDSSSIKFAEDNNFKELKQDQKHKISCSPLSKKSMSDFKNLLQSENDAIKNYSDVFFLCYILGTAIKRELDISLTDFIEFLDSGNEEVITKTSEMIVEELKNQKFRWRRGIDYIIVISDAGMPLFQHSLSGSYDADSGLIAGGLFSIDTLLGEITKHEGISTIKFKDYFILFEAGDYIKLAILSEIDSKEIKTGMKSFVKEFEWFYEETLKNFDEWDGNTKIFSPTMKLIEKLF